MSNRRVISQAGVGRVTRVLALSGLVIAACQPSGLDDPPSVVVPTGTPIQQDDRIPIEIDVNGEWVPAHPSLAGLERFAQGWCVRSRRAGDDAKLCANAGATAGTTVPSDFLSPVQVVRRDGSSTDTVSQSARHNAARGKTAKRSAYGNSS